MFKDDYKKKYDSIAPDPAFRLRLEDRIEEMQNRKNRRWMPRTAMVALATMLVLTTVGFATGAFRSIFAGRVNDFANDPTVDYLHMEENAGTDLKEYMVLFEAGAGATVKLEQSYYNGQQLALGWSLTTDGSEVEFFDKSDARVAASEESVLSVDLTDKLGEENAAEFERIYNENGWVGVAWYDCYLGDHVYLDGFEKEVGDDGLSHAPAEVLLFPEESGSWQEDGATLYYEEYETPLPDAAQGQDGLTIVRKVNSQMCWLIVDGDKVYTGRDAAESMELVFEVPCSEDYAETSYIKEAIFPEYTAAISLTCTPIKAEFSVSNQVSESWKTIWSEYGGYLHAPLNLAEDIVFDYEILVDGEKVSYDTTSYEGVNGVSGYFLLPADAKKVTFRPVYANSGAHADEDVVIDLTVEAQE